ncbi:MAG: GNAT family N-acetyltransferase [Firmicutes bacterium]|nr:GNAT family N-acetyltransferase [Bacillota bacterium]
MNIREFTKEDLPEMINIWNEIVEQGVAFPQNEGLTNENAYGFFASQSFTAVAEKNGEIIGLYILHPNNVGRCGHISNASYAVKANQRGNGIGAKLVTDCLERAKTLGFRILQFNAVVKTNESAIHLYKKLGFTPLGTIPGGFLMKNGEYEDIIPFYKVL